MPYCGLQCYVFTALYVFTVLCFHLMCFLNTLARQARDWVVAVFSNQFVLNQHWGKVSFYRLVLVFTIVFTICDSTCICLQYVFTCVCIVTVTSLLQQDIVKSSCVFQFPVGTQSLSTSIRSAPEQTQSSSCWPWLTRGMHGDSETKGQCRVTVRPKGNSGWQWDLRTIYCINYCP